MGIFPRADLGGLDLAVYVAGVMFVPRMDEYNAEADRVRYPTMGMRGSASLPKYGYSFSETVLG